MHGYLGFTVRKNKTKTQNDHAWPGCIKPPKAAGCAILGNTLHDGLSPPSEGLLPHSTDTLSEIISENNSMNTIYAMRRETTAVYRG